MYRKYFILHWAEVGVKNRVYDLLSGMHVVANGMNGRFINISVVCGWPLCLMIR